MTNVILFFLLLLLWAKVLYHNIMCVAIKCVFKTEQVIWKQLKSQRLTASSTENKGKLATLRKNNKNIKTIKLQIVTETIIYES